MSTTREGMANLINRLRLMVNDPGSATWTDAQLQDVLDTYRADIYREELLSEKTLTSGTTYVYRIFRSRWGNLEEASSGTAYFKIEDSAGEQRGTAEYSVDYIRGVITMDNDQGGTALYLTARSYDLNAAAAECWRRMAGSVSAYYDVSADGHNMSRSEWFRHCLEMSEFYARQAQPITVRQWVVGDIGME